MTRLTRHRTRLTQEAWAAKEAIEAAGFREPHTNRPLKGTQSIVEFALIQFEVASREARRYLERNQQLVDESDAMQKKLAQLEASLVSARANQQEADEQAEDLAQARARRHELHAETIVLKRKVSDLTQEKQALTNERDDLLQENQHRKEREMGIAVLVRESVVAEAAVQSSTFPDLMYQVAHAHAALTKDLDICRRLNESHSEELGELRTRVAEAQAKAAERDALQQTLDSITNKEELLGLQAERDEARARAQSLSNAICCHVRDCGGEENVPQVPLAEALQAVRENFECAVEQRDAARADLDAASEREKSMLAKQELLRQQNNRLVSKLQKVNVLLADEKGRVRDPRWIVAGVVGIAVGAAAMLLLRLWGV